MYRHLRGHVSQEVYSEIGAIRTKAETPGALRAMSDDDLSSFLDRLEQAGADVQAVVRAIPAEDGARGRAEQDLRHLMGIVGGKIRGELSRREAIREDTANEARLRDEWIASDERRRSGRRALVGVGGGALLAIVGWSVYLNGGISDQVALFVVVAGVYGGALLAVLSIRSGKVGFEARRRLKELNAETVRTAEALSEAPDDPSKFIEYWVSTQQRLDKFHADARGQLRSAYLLSQAAAGLGFLVVLVLGVVAAVAPTTTSSVVVGGVAAVAAALSGYVSRTFQVAYDRALRQTMTYFEQPVIASRLLHGERLLTMFEDGSEAKNQALLVLVRAATAAEPEEPAKR